MTTTKGPAATAGPQSHASPVVSPGSSVKNTATVAGSSRRGRPLSHARAEALWADLAPRLDMLDGGLLARIAVRVLAAWERRRSATESLDFVRLSGDVYDQLIIRAAAGEVSVGDIAENLLRQALGLGISEVNT